LVFVIAPIIAGKINPNYKFDSVEIAYIWMAVIVFFFAPDEFKSILRYIPSIFSKLKRINVAGNVIDFNPDDKINEVLKVLSRIEESGLQQVTEPDLSQYSKSIFEQVNRKIDNPVEALREAKKIAIENLGSIFEETGEFNVNNPIFSEQTFLRVLSELQKSNKIGIDRGVNDVFTDLNKLNIFIENKSNPKSDDLLNFAELYTRLARILYEERLKIRLRKGLSVPKPSTPNSATKDGMFWNNSYTK
jgi:hypothetical protein